MRQLLTQSQEFFNSPEEFKKWIGNFAKNLSSKECIMLSGDLGAGKTFFVVELLRCLGGALGASPSFAIHNRYPVRDFYLDHVDLYRLKNLDDLESTGFWDLFSAERGIIAVEWANKLKVEDILWGWPVWEIKIHKSPQSETGRILQIFRWLGSSRG